MCVERHTEYSRANLEPGKRIAVVCSARSSTTKDQGTTNRLVRAAIDVLEPNSGKFRDIVETIRLDHLQAGKDACSVWGASSSILDQYTQAVNAECRNLLKILESAMFLKAVTDQTEDMVISVGEKLSCLYMAALLQSRGTNAQYLDLSEVIHGHTGKSLDENSYLNLGIAIADRVLALDADAVPIITGYFGPVPGGLLKEVGRGYTDLCAALTAVGLGAQELQIWKEVDGIFTADPRKVPTARLLDSVTPSEAAELTFYGSEVIHPFTMDQVIKASIPIRIKNVMNPRNKGTVVIPDIEDSLAVRRPGLFRGRSSSNLTEHERPKRCHHETRHHRTQRALQEAYASPRLPHVHFPSPRQTWPFRRPHLLLRGPRLHGPAQRNLLTLRLRRGRTQNRERRSPRRRR